jgi:hypothetical protein
MKIAVNSIQDISFQLDEFYSELRDDGRSIKFLDRKDIERRPYPGLRPFKTSEFQLFNGRDGQAEELISRLKANPFLSVIGSSGTGKSSLIRAGLIPQLLAGYLQGAGTNWDIAICRPGKNPVENLAIALARTKCRSSNKEEIIKEYNLIYPLLNRSHYGILDVNELLNPPDQPLKEKSNFLVIIDQFEELFRFNRDDLGKPDLENHFVNLLLNASLKPEASIYVIITMRSEFLGDCAKYRGLPEAINKGQYLVPQLNRDQIREVIEDPILLAGKKIAPGLVELLVNEIEESKTKKDLDQLPILQHALMRTYQEAMKNGTNAEITYEHYKAAGGLEKALANHADEKYKELSDGSREISFKQKLAKIIFQALTDASSDKKGGRRPTELKNIYGIARSLNATEQQVDEVVNKFRDTETSFIMPPANTPLFPELIMDISHETLMRQWKTLSDWVSEEAESAKYYLRLVDSASQHRNKEKDFLSGSELQLALDWFNKFKPVAAWSNRYKGGFQECMDYLKGSEAERDSLLNLEKKRTRRLKWFRNSLIILSILFGIGAGIAWIVIRDKNKEILIGKEQNLKTIADLQSFQKKKDSIVNSIIGDSLNKKIDKIQVEEIKPAMGIYYQGGIIFDLDNTGEHGLIVAQDDLFNGNKTDWANAKILCDSFNIDDYHDWRLPTLDELKLIYEQKDNIAGLKNDLYWSSTELDNIQARLINFSNGYTSYHYNKNRSFYVRAVRNF